MAIRTDFTAGEVLAAADLNDTFAAKANLASPTFTGTPAAPTAASGTNTTQLATTAFVLANGNAGLVHINTTAFSAASSVSVNSVFTSTYENYRILINYTASSSGSLQVRLRASGTDNSTSNYSDQYLVGAGATVVAARASAQTLSSISELTTSRSLTTMDIFSPQTAFTKSFTSVNVNSGTAVVFQSWAGNLNLTSAFDGITFIASAGNMTGTLRIYGYKNS